MAVSNLTFMFDLDATLDQNLSLTLTSPDGRKVRTPGRCRGTGQNFRNTTFADDAPISIADGQAPFTGRFRPL